MEWVRVSGDVVADAAYVLSLPTMQLRERELRRLGRVYGAGHRGSVRRAVKENWPAAESKLSPLPMEKHSNPRLAALAAVGGKGGI